MMRNDINSKLTSYAKDNDSILSMFIVKSENNENFNRVYTVVNEVIISKLEDELSNLFDDVILLNRKKESSMLLKNKLSYTTIEIYKKDNLKLSESIIAEDVAEEFIKTLPSDIEFIYNKPGFTRLKPNEFFRYELPKEYEFIASIKNFFSTAIEVSFYINQKDEIAAGLMMDKLRAELINMLNFYILNKYSRTMNIGEDYRNINSTLEIELKEDLRMTFHHDDLYDIYNSLFRACVLFRKIAMGLSEDFDYEYPREIDVESLRLLRDNYKKLESFLS